MSEAHCTPRTPHLGVIKMYQDLQTNFWWEELKNTANFVQKCFICHQIKAKHKKPLGLLIPLSIAE